MYALQLYLLFQLRPAFVTFWEKSSYIKENLRQKIRQRSSYPYRHNFDFTKKLPVLAHDSSSDRYPTIPKQKRNKFRLRRPLSLHVAPPPIIPLMTRGSGRDKFPSRAYPYLPPNILTLQANN